MKTLVLLASFFLATAATQAADGTWGTDLPKALELAKVQKKMVLVDFTGSDWCPPCQALHKNVLETKEFGEFAKDNLVLVEIDFPKSKAQSDEMKAANQALSKKYSITGYPTILVFDATGKEVFRKVGYRGTSAKDYVEDLTKLKQ